MVALLSLSQKSSTQSNDILRTEMKSNPWTLIQSSEVVTFINTSFLALLLTCWANREVRELLVFLLTKLYLNREMPEKMNSSTES